MKKKVFATLLLAGMVLGTGQAAFAETTVDNNKNQTINNGDGKETDKLDKGITVPVYGELGKIDNTDPDTKLPEGDSRWIHVKLPTEAYFHTTGEKNEIIESESHHIVNLSGRPINVSLSSFTGADGQKAAVTELNLKPNQTEFETVKLVGGTEVKDKLLATLSIPTKGENNYDFQYTGKTDSDLLSSVENIKVQYDMVLKFEVLNADSESVVKP